MQNKIDNDVQNWVAELQRVMGCLRDKESGCPWDLEQTHASLKPYLIEETYELVDAIDAGDEEKIVEELGDVLLQVIFHCQLAREDGTFDLNDVARRCCEKLIHRHPHVFGEDQLETSEQVLSRWEKIKHGEKGNEDRVSLLDGIPRHLPALAQADKIQRKAARAGFDWPSRDMVIGKLREEYGELLASLDDGGDDYREELGDTLFSLVNLARYHGDSSEELLRQTIEKFYRRFRHIEARSTDDGKEISDYSLDELMAWWQEAKGN